jgi:hypothetical protein
LLSLLLFSCLLLSLDLPLQSPCRVNRDRVYTRQTKFPVSKEFL